MENGRPFWQLALPICLFVLAINFLAMPGEEYPGDAHAVRTETITLLNTGKWAVPPETAVTFGPRGQYFYQNARGDWYPKYGVLNTLIYAPALALEKIVTGRLELDSPSRLLFLNLFNVALSGVTAFYLVLLARRYTKSSAAVVIFVLASLYSTLWWNYLRAQTFEIYHTLFLLAFYYHFVTSLDLYRGNGDKRTSNIQFPIAAIYLGALCLCKSVYVVLLPVLAATLAQATMSTLRQERKGRVISNLVFFWLPLCLLLCILLATNWYKFGSPFTTGYTQWETEAHLFKPSNLPIALRGFLFDQHRSAPLHFPILIFALAGWPTFFKRHKLDATTALLIGFLLLLVNSMFTNWSGESSYGPRYLLPILPILSLPFIQYLEWLDSLSRKPLRYFLSTATAVALIYSTFLQVSVNTWPFFFSYELRDLLEDKRRSNPALVYLRSHAFGTIARDFLFFNAGYTSPFADGFYRHLTPGEIVKMDAFAESVRANYYWFPNLFRESREEDEGQLQAK
jgi:hypothetical protein